MSTFERFLDSVKSSVVHPKLRVHSSARAMQRAVLEADGALEAKLAAYVQTQAIC